MLKSFGKCLYKGNKKALIPKGDKRYQSPNPKQIIQQTDYTAQIICSQVFATSQILIKGANEMLVLGLVIAMIVAMEISDFVSKKVDEAKETAERKAVFQSFYAADKSLKYLK